MYRKKQELPSSVESSLDQSTDDTLSSDGKSVSSDIESETQQKVAPSQESKLNQEATQGQRTYKDILVHNVFVSVQEHQKKMKVF